MLSAVGGPELAGISLVSEKSYVLFTRIVPCVVYVVYVFIIALVIICLIRMVKYLATSSKEQRLIRMELSKVAEEVHLMREKIEGGAEKKEQESEEQD
jgi:ammonia channel protein AmtB